MEAVRRLPAATRRRRSAPENRLAAVTDTGHDATVASENDPIEWLEDVSAAGWIAPRLHPSVQDVGSIIPEGFEAYGRLFHPVEGGRHGRRERWSELARRNQRIVHPEMQFHSISRPVGQRPPGWYDAENGPSWGSLPVPELRVLVEVLERYTTTRDSCFFCVWEGYDPFDEDHPIEWHEAGTLGALSARLRPRRPRRSAPPLPHVELPGRRYYLYRGPLEKALAPLPFDHSPNLWWPEDRAWFIATEIDYAWTYVGGSQELIGELIGDSRLEVLPARLSDEPFYDADVLNEALESGSGA